MGSKECRNRVDIGRFDCRRPDDAPLSWRFVGDVRLSCTGVSSIAPIYSSFCDDSPYIHIIYITQYQGLLENQPTG